MQASLLLFALLFSSFLLHIQTLSQTSSEDQLPPSRYRGRGRADIDPVFGPDAAAISNTSKCHIDMDIIWKTKLAGSINNAPLLTNQLDSQNNFAIFATRDHYIEVLNTKTGKKEFGFPAVLPGSSFSTSPLLFDIDHDGIMEIVVSTTEGEIVFLDDKGVPKYGRTLKVPPLRVLKNWYEGLDSPNVQSSFSLFNDETLHKKSGDQHDDPSFSLNRGRKLQAVEDDDDEPDTHMGQTFHGIEGWMTPEGIKSFELFLPGEVSQNIAYHAETDPLYSPQYEHWKSTDVAQQKEGHVYIPAHILTTPVIADLENDGVYEMVVGVSYYFQYSDHAHLPVDVSPEKYIACGIVVFDLSSSSIRWEAHLDLTTDLSSYRAYMYSQPVVADLNGDEKLEIIAATGVGFIYAFYSNGRIVETGFPVSMDSIYSPLVAYDVNNDGEMEIIAVDVNANLVCWNILGQELWETRVTGVTSQRIALADIDSNGIIDLIGSTSDGFLWAVRGDNGKLLKNFPVKLNTQIYSDVIVLNLRGNHPELVFAGGDDHVYIYDPIEACMEKVDLAEPVFNMILADDLIHNGKLDLLITTLRGNVYCLATNVTFHPLSAWKDSSQQLARLNYYGIYFTEETRARTDINGEYFPVSYEIVDKREILKESIKQRIRYKVSIYVDRELKLTRTYTEPGVYSATIHSPHQGTASQVVITMTNEYRQEFRDNYTAKFNINFFRVIKWLIFGPFCLMSLILYALTVKQKSNKQ